MRRKFGPVGFLEELEHLLSPILAGVDLLLGGDDDSLSPQDQSTGFLSGPAALLGQVPLTPTVPGGPSGLHGCADAAAGAYRQTSGAMAVTDEKLAELLRQILTSNEETRAKIGGIVAGIQTAHHQLMTDPKLARPARAGAVRPDVRSAARRDPTDPGIGEGGRQEASRAAGRPGRGVPRDRRRTRQARYHRWWRRRWRRRQGLSWWQRRRGKCRSWWRRGRGGVVDPLAGMGGMPAGMIGDPMSMLGPALAGLGSIPGAFGGAGAALPMVGALGPLAGAMTGRGDGFTDEGPRERGKPANFAEDSHAGPEGGQQNSGSDGAPITKPDPSASAAPLDPVQPGHGVGEDLRSPGPTWPECGRPVERCGVGRPDRSECRCGARGGAGDHRRGRGRHRRRLGRAGTGARALQGMQQAAGPMMNGLGQHPGGGTPGGQPAPESPESPGGEPAGLDVGDAGWAKSAGRGRRVRRCVPVGSSFEGTRRCFERECELPAMEGMRRST